jgi:asparagine synthase (glutamine-hydrolysing)
MAAVTSGGKGSAQMCGIVGLVDTRQDVPEAVLAVLRDTMARRGPDGTGGFREGAAALAMRRLAVIDVAEGGQPLFAADGRVVAFQNGEIYNHLELRRELEGRGARFRTHSDTEALAQGYAAWGIEELLRRVDGMFALAILDRGRRELHLARDRFGEKPLFYAHAPGRFAYASSLLALAALPWVDLAIDRDALDRYLALHYVPGEATIFRGIRRVLPGHRLHVPLDDPRPSAARYHRLELGPARAVPDDELAAAVEQAVVSRLVADVPVGVFLSGGLDSSIVAALAARHRPGIATFSMGFAAHGYDESPFAREVAQAVGSGHHHFLFDEQSFRTLLPEVMAALDEPLGDQALLPLHWLCREARRHVTVALAGEGADEVFAGYSYYRDALRAPRRWPTLTDNAEAVTPSGFPLLSAAAERAALAGGHLASAGHWERDLVRWLDQAADPLQRATAADLATWLPDDLLVKFDRMAMAHGLEGRAPFLQPALAEMGTRLPPSDRVQDGTVKAALRRVAARWLPHAIVERGKHGFILPMESWLKDWFQAQGGPAPCFRGAEAVGLDPAAAAAVVTTDLRAGVRRPRLLFALLALVEWQRAFSLSRASLAAAVRAAERAA